MKKTWYLVLPVIFGLSMLGCEVETQPDAGPDVDVFESPDAGPDIDIQEAPDIQQPDIDIQEAPDINVQPPDVDVQEGPDVEVQPPQGGQSPTERPEGAAGEEQPQ